MIKTEAFRYLFLVQNILWRKKCWHKIQLEQSGLSGKKDKGEEMRKWANDTKTWLLGSNQCVYVILIPLTFHLIYFRIFRFSFSYTFLLLMIHSINVAVTSLWINHAYLEKSFLFWFSRIKTIFYANGFLEVPKRHLFCDHKHLRVCLCMSMSCPLLCVFSCWIKLKDIKEIGIRIGSMFAN